MKKVLAIIIATVMCAALSISIFAHEGDTSKNAKNKATITEAYDYPITQASSEWKAFQTHAEMIEACQIPKSILSRLSTEALLESVLDYPLLGDMLAFDNVSSGYRSVFNSFNGLQELSKREDMYSVLKAYDAKGTARGILNGALSKRCADVVISELLGSVQAEPRSLVTTRIAEVTNNNVITPNGTQVPHYEHLTYSDLGLYEQSEIDGYEDYLDETYPSAVKIAYRKPSYNCHSYAWHSTATSNYCWINNPSYYWLDSSYSVTQVPSAGDKLIFINSNYVDHSAIIYDPLNNTVKSKWGAWGTYRHSRTYSPYSDMSTLFTAYE